MTKFKVGNLVKVTRSFKTNEGPTRLTWDPRMSKFVGQICPVTDISDTGNLQLRYGNDKWYFYPHVLEHVGKSHAARILTEKVTIEGVPCRKILGFEGILSWEELPEKYNKGLPKFDFDKDEKSAHRFVFDGKDICLRYSELSRGVLHFHVPDAEPKIESYCFCLTYMNIGDILPEKTFQQILVWLKRAGSRLAKIRKQEKAAWAGKETIEI